MHRLLLVALGLLALACSRPRFYLPPAPAASDKVLVIAPQNAGVYVKDSVNYSAMFIVPGGSISCAPTQWLTGDEQIARINPSTGILWARSPGTTTVLALCEGLQVSTPVHVWARQGRGAGSARH